MGLGDFLLSVISGMLGSLLIVEWVTGCDKLARFLVKWAAERLPEPQRDDILAQWLADIQDTESPTWKLLCALSNRFQVRGVAKAYGVNLQRSKINKFILDTCFEWLFNVAFDIYNAYLALYDDRYFALKVCIGILLVPFYIAYKIFEVVLLILLVTKRAVSKGMDRVVKKKRSNDTDLQD